MLPLLRIRFDLFTTENRLIVWRSNCFNVSLVSPTVIFRPSSGFGRYRLFVSPPAISIAYAFDRRSTRRNNPVDIAFSLVLDLPSDENVFERR